MCKIQLNIYISLGFYLLSCEPRRGAEVGRSSQAPARMMRKALPPEKHLSKHLSPTLGCNFTYPTTSANCWSSQTLPCGHSGSLWCQPDHSVSCSQPILPSTSRSRTFLMAKQRQKQNRRDFCSSSLWF